METPQFDLMIATLRESAVFRDDEGEQTDAIEAEIALLKAANLDLCRDITEDFCQGWNAAGGDKDTGALHAADYVAKLSGTTPNAK